MAASKARYALALASALWLGAAHHASAAPAGAVEYTQGVATVQGASSAAHIAGSGVQINQGDTITTASDSYTVLKLTDGTRMTIRPDSKMVVTTYDYRPSESGSTGAMVFSLLRGGLRAITGLIPKRDSNAARIITPTATVGIRGTDFDARLCTNDCGSAGALASATSAAGKGARPNNIIASARVLSESGVITAVNSEGTVRLMASGAPIYPGDTVKTAPSGYAVLVFRDETRMTLQPASSIKIDDFVYDVKQPSEGRFLVSLIKGGLRAFTGLIGKANHDHVGVRTPTATVGIRGTGWDMQCLGSCALEGDAGADDGLKATVWMGEIVINAPECGAGGLALGSGESGSAVSGKKCAKTDDALQFNTPRPDQVDVDMTLEFGFTELAPSQPGLYVLVRDGHVSLELPGAELDLGQGESGYTDGSRLLRPVLTPEFLLYDPTPLGGSFAGSDLLGLIHSQGAAAVCSR